MIRSLSMALAALLIVALTAAPALAKRWVPAQSTSFDYLLGAVPKTPPNVKVVVLDMFDTTRAQIKAYKAKNIKPICYINVGAWEDWRPDAGKFPKVMRGNAYDGWAGERWLDIRKLTRLKPLIRARLDKCKAKGFLGVDPDNLDSWQVKTGFPIRKRHSIAYLRWLAKAAHQRGLSIGLKNVPELAITFADSYDFAVTESCFKQRWCGDLKPFLVRGKAVLAIEYVENGMTRADFCDRARKRKISGLLKKYDLKGWRRACK